MPLKTDLISICLLNPQVEYHPKLCQTELRSVCEEFGVCFQAYSSLGKGLLITDPVVMEVAKNCERTTAQVNAHTDIQLDFWKKKQNKQKQQYHKHPNSSVPSRSCCAGQCSRVFQCSPSHHIQIE